ncbi:MAG: hypothetical protein IIA88_04265 [Bacteroidetes bacterium]|nr:hypothetical protein [Bacteroidota bacterium]
MGRIRTNIKIGQKNFWTLFDSGARNTYIIEEIARELTTIVLKNPRPVSLGGETHNVVQTSLLECEIEGLPIEDNALVLNRIGIDDEGKKIEVIIGALTMQRWGINLNLVEEKLDMTNYPKDFVEFLNI